MSAPILHRPHATPGELTAARELARLRAAPLRPQSGRIARGLFVALATPRASLPAALFRRASAQSAWLWLRIQNDNTGELLATHASFLWAAVRLLAHPAAPLATDALARGVFLPASFALNRPIWDGAFAQYWRSARGFDPERYVATLAESGFTHVEVNSLATPFAHEDSVPGEFYAPFYSYCPGFNHFVATPLTRGLWPKRYLDANLRRLQHLAALGRRYGLKPSVCLYEPRSFPERFFRRYPTLRGARIDHPFRSHLPRYTLAQDHPVAQQHYRAALQALMAAVPDLDAMSLWTNDSGSGFEHTASLYVGRNGGPFLIREWRSHDKVAQAAGQSIGRFLRNLHSAGAALNPDFKLSLRIEPFKVEHDHLKAELGRGVHWEGPSLLARGYTLPYSHPRYADQTSVAGGMFHCQIDPREKTELARERAAGVEPILSYSPGPVWNQEPLLGIPWPRMLHARLTQLRATGVNLVSAMGGLAHTQATPYWPNPAAIRAAQFTPDRPIADVLLDEAVRFAGRRHAAALARAWELFENAVTWQPVVPLFCHFGFVWQRTWDRPLVPDIEAIPPAERAYYERHGCFQFNNPGLYDLGRDVLFELISRDFADRATHRFDRNVLPRLARAECFVAATLVRCAADPQATAVFTDLRDRLQAYRHWATTLRNVVAWCAHVYGYLGAKTARDRRRHEQALQASIDLELANTRGLLDLVTTSSTEFMALSADAENTFIYGANFPDHLRRKIRLTEKYRHHTPRIPTDILWRAPADRPWPK